MDKKLSTLILALGILLLAAFLRLYGVNWDQGQHLHPDERFLTMVATGISWPKDFGEYLDTGISPLNPHNRGFGFFVYGTFPVFFTKWVAELLGKGDYGNLTIIGRQLSAMVDLGTVILVYLIAKQAISKSKFLISKKSPNAKSQLGQLEIRSIRNLPLLAMFLYSIMVLPIQLSHFYAVDTYLTFFITLSFYLLIRSINNQQSAISNIVFLGIAFGLALASKISAVLFLPIIGIGLVINLITNRNFLSFFVICCLLSVICYLTIRLAQPYVFANGNFFDFTLNQKVLDNWKQLKSFDDPNGWFPPGVQWIKTKPYLFPLKNIVLWGLGLPIGIISLISSAYLVLLIMYYISKKKIYLILNTKYLILFLSFFWILFLFIYQGGQFAKNMRYFIPIYPFLAIIASYFLIQLFYKYKIGTLVYGIIGILFMIYPISFISIYSHPHSRVTASNWIYENIPVGSTLSGEHWDDFLPVSLPKTNLIHEKYQGIEFPLYGVDNQAKWKDMDEKLKKVDYIILTSNRLYGSIMTVPKRYPITSRYYQALFDGSLGFTKVAEFTSRPNLPIPFIKMCLTPPFARYGIVAMKSQECTQTGISFLDDYSDESFTVYDHPKVLIFKKSKPVDYYDLLLTQK